MSCGLTPELIEMFAKMQQDREKGLEQIPEPDSIKKVKKTPTPDDDKGYDWTKTYARWDNWEDPSEVARQEEEERRRRKNLKERKNTMCNHDHSAEQKLMDMSVEEKLNHCDNFRSLGNCFFSEGQYQRAAYYYNRALIYFEYTFPESDEDTDALDMLKLKVLLNYAACSLKSQEFDSVINYCTQALQIDEKNSKAFFRRAQAFRLKDEYDKASEDIDKAIEYNPSGTNKSIQLEKNTIQTKRMAYLFNSKKAFSSIFERQTKRTVKGKTDQEKEGVSFQLVETPEITCDSFDTWLPDGTGKNELTELIEKLKGDDLLDRTILDV